MILDIFLYGLLILIGIIFFVWVLINIYFHSSNIKIFPLKKLKRKKILIILAHPDDEATSCSGTLTRLSKTSEVKMIILTKGERGQEGMKIDPQLKNIRTQELQNSLNIMNIKNLQHLDIGDNQLKDKYGDVKEIVEEEIKKFSPNVVITHDPSGLYGHPDHITVSEIVTNLQKIYQYSLWYTTLSKKILKNINMSNEASIETKKNSTALPNIRIFVLFQIFKKIRIVYGYKSQRNSFIKTLPFKFIPLWFYIALTPFEYFKERE